MKKNSVLFAILLIANITYAQIAESKKLKGAWREVARLRNGQPIRISDTLFFEVVTSELCIWGKSSPTAPRVRLKQIGTTLIIGPKEFDIVDQQSDWMKLSADEGLQIEMLRYNNKPIKLTPKPKNKKQSNPPIAKNPNFKPGAAAKMGNVPKNIEPLVGKWTCYKRTTDKPLQADYKYRLLRLVEIEDKDDIITAKLFGFDDLEGVPSWVVQNYEGGILYSAGKDERNFKVIDCQPNELVIENEGVIYYMHQLKQ